MSARTLTDFIGTYDFTRHIEHGGGDAVDVTGVAVIEPSGAGAHYRETGRMVMGDGAAFDTQQRYVWQERAGRIFVTFADGRSFHDFDPVRGGTVSKHLCGADTYCGGYDFSEWTCWAVTWDVTGPRKDYRSVTRYLRQ